MNEQKEELTTFQPARNGKNTVSVTWPLGGPHLIIFSGLICPQVFPLISDKLSAKSQFGGGAASGGEGKTPDVFQEGRQEKVIPQY